MTTPKFWLYRLRIDEIRAFYDVFYQEEEGLAEILAIREKAAAIKQPKAKDGTPTQ